MLNVKNSIVFTIILSLLFSLCVSAETEIPFAGEGSEANPYLISTSEEMYEFAEIVNSGYSFEGEYLKLTDDLLLFDAGTSTAEIKNTWIPIGTDFDCSFNGSFDGDGHEIKGVYIYSDGGIQGLFGCVWGGEIKNLTLSESVISGSGHYVGGIAAIILSSDEGNHNDGLIENCVNNATVANSDMHTGGIAASAVRVVDCVNNGDVNSESSWVSGIVNDACRVENCINNGNVTAESDVAGVCYSTYCEQSHNYERGLINCINNGTVTGENECFGITSLSWSIIISDSEYIGCANYGDVNSAETPDDLLGDMNGDKKITAADGRIILRCAAKIDSSWNISETMINGDFNADGKLTAADARKCLRYSAKVDDYFKDFGVNIK